MNPSTKNNAIKLRNQGLSYKEISENLNENFETIKSLFKRIKNPNLSEVKFCENCGKEMINTKGHRPRRFCCNKCKDEWWNSNRDLLKHKVNRKVKCLHCGKEFTFHSNANRKYCSVECFLKETRKNG